PTRRSSDLSFWLEKSVRTAIAVPMANDPPFATLNHVAGDLGIPSESALLRIGITSGSPAGAHCGRIRSRRRGATTPAPFAASPPWSGDRASYGRSPGTAPQTSDTAR